MAFIAIPKGKTQIRMADGNWIDIPSGVTEVDSAQIWSGGSDNNSSAVGSDINVTSVEPVAEDTFNPQVESYDDVDTKGQAWPTRSIIDVLMGRNSSPSDKQRIINDRELNRELNDAPLEDASDILFGGPVTGGVTGAVAGVALKKGADAVLRNSVKRGKKFIQKSQDKINANANDVRNIKAYDETPKTNVAGQRTEPKRGAVLEVEIPKSGVREKQARDTLKEPKIPFGDDVMSWMPGASARQRLDTGATENIISRTKGSLGSKGGAMNFYDRFAKDFKRKHPEISAKNIDKAVEDAFSKEYGKIPNIGDVVPAIGGGSVGALFGTLNERKEKRPVDALFGKQ